MNKIINKNYRIAPVIWLVKDEESTKFHIHRDDYFGTVATILGLIAQTIEKKQPANRQLLIKILDNLKRDFMFLQKNYRIERAYNLKVKKKTKK
jgi:hypothetical protein